MANENSHLSGTVIQRTFIPNDLGIVLHIATVPIEDLCNNYEEDGSKDFLNQVVSETLGIPQQSILTQSQYQALMNSISSGKYRMWLRKSYPHRGFFFDRGVSDEFARELEREVEHFMESPSESNNPFGSRLALHSLGLMSSPTKPDFHHLLLPIYRFSDFKLLNENLIENLSRENFEVGFACLTSNINPDNRVKTLIEEIQKYDIPSGQSPETKSESLAQLIRTSRSVCIAPIIAGSAIAGTHLQQGAYVMALLDVTTAAAATLILVSTISFAEVIARKLAENRGRRRRVINRRQKPKNQTELKESKPKELETDEKDSSSES